MKRFHENFWVGYFVVGGHFERRFTPKSMAKFCRIDVVAGIIMERGGEEGEELYYVLVV